MTEQATATNCASWRCPRHRLCGCWRLGGTPHAVHACSRCEREAKDAEDYAAVTAPTVLAVLDVLAPAQDGYRIPVFEWGHETTPTAAEMIELAHNILDRLDAVLP